MNQKLRLFVSVDARSFKADLSNNRYIPWLSLLDFLLRCYGLLRLIYQTIENFVTLSTKSNYCNALTDTTIPDIPWLSLPDFLLR